MEEQNEYEGTRRRLRSKTKKKKQTKVEGQGADQRDQYEDEGARRR